MSKENSLRRTKEATATTRRAFFAQSCAAVAGGFTLGCRSHGSISMGCAAGWRFQVEPLVAEWCRKHSMQANTTYDGSGRLVSSVNAGMQLDLILTADVSYLDELPISYSRHAPRFLQTQTARLVTKAANRDVVTWDAVLRGDVRLSVASPSSAAIGRITFRTLDGAIREKLQRAVTVERSTVTEVANDVAVFDAADAGIVWDTTWPNDERLVTVPAPPLTQAEGAVGILVSDLADAPAVELANWLQQKLQPDA